MSLLFRKNLSIVLCPDQIALQLTAHQFTLRGRKLDALRQEIIPAETGGEMPWNGALDALEKTLPRFVRTGMQATVILSNHFVHYALVPWCGNLSDEDEMAYARHCFKEVYGDTSDAWEIRVSQNISGKPAIASAVDTKMLGELRGLFGRMRLNAKSIQPHLMVAVNSCRSRLQGRSTWFALLEPGNLCLAVLQRGQFSWIRKMRIGDSWQEELPRLLEREAYLADGGMEMDEVFLWAPHLEEANMPTGGRWNFQYLKPTLRSTGGPVRDGLRDSSEGVK